MCFWGEKHITNITIYTNLETCSWHVFPAGGSTSATGGSAYGHVPVPSTIGSGGGCASGGAGGGYVSLNVGKVSALCVRDKICSIFLSFLQFPVIWATSWFNNVGIFVIINELAKMFLETT